MTSFDWEKKKATFDIWLMSDFEIKGTLIKQAGQKDKNDEKFNLKEFLFKKEDDETKEREYAELQKERKNCENTQFWFYFSISGL